MFTKFVNVFSDHNGSEWFLKAGILQKKTISSLPVIFSTV
jgi:hypothetical protein